MKNNVALAVLLFSTAMLFAQAQSQKDSIKAAKYQKLMDKVQQLPDAAIGKPDNGPDSSMYFLKNDNMQMTVVPMWQEKGTQMGDNLKVPKINEDPLDGTIPLGDKKYASGMVITMSSIRKTVDDRKQMVLNQVKAHLAALYKQGGKQVSADDMAQQVNSMVTGPESFTTEQGKKGDLYIINDYQPQQSNFNVVFLMPGSKPGYSYLVQFNYYKYIYDSDLPDDITDLKVFMYPDDQNTYIAFSKKFLKTFTAP